MRSTYLKIKNFVETISRILLRKASSCRRNSPAQVCSVGRCNDDIEL